MQYVSACAVLPHGVLCCAVCCGLQAVTPVTGPGTGQAHTLGPPQVHVSVHQLVLNSTLCIYVSCCCSLGTGSSSLLLVGPGSRVHPLGRAGEAALGANRSRQLAPRLGHVANERNPWHSHAVPALHLCCCLWLCCCYCSALCYCSADQQRRSQQGCYNELHGCHV